MSNEQERIRAVLARRTTAMKDIMEDKDLGETSRILKMLDVSNQLNEDLFALAQDTLDRRRSDQDRFREDVRPRDSRPRDNYDDRSYRDDYRNDDYGRRDNGSHRPYGGSGPRR